MTHSYSRAMPQQVPLTVYQQVVSDLEAAHMRLAQMSGEYDQLKQQYQQLQAEVQVICQRLQALAPGKTPAWTPEPAPEPAPDFEFLNQLKRRQQANPPQPSVPSRSAPPETRNPSPEFTRPRSRYPGRYEASAPNLDPLDNLFTDPGIPYDTETSAYRRAREQHGGSGFSWLWIGVAAVLIVGSFGAGFLVVQPFVSGDKPPAPTLPTPKTP
ncbi:MAG: hypothetical protein Q6K99_10405 [Thermostichales cyanobacterium BF4_bins_65]